MSATMVGRQRKCQVSDGVKRPLNSTRNYNLAKYFYQYFQIISIFIYNESLPMKSYQFFKICKCFDKERKNTFAAVNEKRKTEKKLDLVSQQVVLLCYMIIIFCFESSFAAQFLLFDIWVTRDIKRRGREQEIAAIIHKMFEITRVFLLVLTTFFSWRGGWALGYYFIKF